MARQRFTATLEEAGRGGGRWVRVPFDARVEFGEARPPVTGTVNGVAFRSRLAVYGGQTVLGLTKELRDAASISLGDAVEIVINRDEAPREVEIHPLFLAALDAHQQARSAFQALSFTHRREYARWIAAAKREDTRQRRVSKAIEMPGEGVKTPD
jgi:hypothetical protein